MRIAFVFIAAVLLCSTGFYNGFPLVYSDTGSYMEMGFNNHVLADRPITYGLFLRHVSLSESLWLVVFVQAFLLAWSVYIVFRYFSSTQNFTRQYILFFLTIVLFTGVSVNVSQLIPDIFTSILILNLIVLLFGENVAIKHMVICGLLVLVSLMMHNSHLAILFLFQVTAGLTGLIRLWRKKTRVLVWSRWSLGMALLFSGWLLLSTLHYTMGGRFSPSGGSHVFTMNRLLEMGILEDYLADACKRHNYKICAYQGQFPADFLWDYKSSPLHKTGDWETNREEYNQIISDVFSQPLYIKKFIIRSIEASFRQFFMFDTGDTPQMGPGSPPFGTVHWFYHDLVREYQGSKQYAGHLHFDLINFAQKILIFSSLVFMALFLWVGLEPRHKTLALSIVVLVFLNACACATLGGVFDRFQSRVVWLLVLPVFVAFTDQGLVDRLWKRKQADTNV